MKTDKGHIISTANEGRVLLISAGMKRPKKAHNPLAKLNLYLNYGLLGLATILKQKKYNPTLFHGHFHNPEEFVCDLERDGYLQTEHPILLSIPSSYAIEWARETCRLIKKIRPDSSIVVGGRWVTADDGAWIRKQIPDIDLVVFGTAEHCIEAILHKAMWPKLGNTDVADVSDTRQASALSQLDYSMLDRFHDFTPSFEVSRGCGRGCGFCAEGNVPLSLMKDAGLLADEIEAYISMYGKSNLRAYFEASLFNPSLNWIIEISKQFHDRQLSIQWRTESRADALSPRHIEKLAKAGLKVLDIGLESASHQQLLNMHKTTSPATYLRRASELVRACHANGVWTKVNVLLYPGETKATLMDTINWLEQHREFIKGVSAGPLIMYRYGDASLDFLRQIERYGAKVVSDTDLDAQGFADIHLSKEFSHQDAISAANEIARNFMSAKDYFDLKSFNYFSRELTYENFNALAIDVPEHGLPFRPAHENSFQGRSNLQSSAIREAI